ncbi:MAG TPA: hypothetical protein VFU05_01585 [Cyclobacteriaceae bacterium]|nr:hypothetical protein [Cyclobacteriaceae bacterium]
MKQIWTLFFLFGSVFRLAGQEQTLTVGIVIDTVKCKANEKQSYALYLPKDYSRGSTWPVVFFYDPAARGNLPVNQYRSIAEKYQCILVGSNNSRNGPLNVTQEAEQAMLRDVENRFSIDKGRLFISGFSGGARASVYMAMQRKIYAGIIACGAAFPVIGKLSKENIPFIEVVGNRDMNFTEAIQTEDYLTGINYPHALLLFQGTHAWPPPETYDQAIFWQLFRVKPPSKSLAISYDSSIVTKAKQEIASGQLWLAHWNLKNVISFSLKVDSLKKSISSKPMFVKQQKSFVKVLQNENDIVTQIYERLGRLSYAKHDSVFKESEWKSMLMGVKKYGKSDNILEVDMSERIVQQVTIACFENYKQQLKLKNYFQSSLAARVLVLVQPEPNSYVMLARSYAKIDRRNAAVQALSKAAELGLSDKSVLKSNDFSMLVSEKKFNAVVQQVELNAKKVIGH